SLAGAPIEPRVLLEGAARAREACAGGERDVLVIEGVGGLLTPLADEFTVRDLACALALPLLVAARPGLGTISHTLLTLECARASALDVPAVVLTPWPARPSTLERSNHETIERLGAIEVCTLPHIPGPDPRALARAGAALPWERWLGAPAGAPHERTLLAVG